MDRRSFLQYITAALAGPSTYHSVASLRTSSSKHIDVSVFMTESVQDAADHDDPYFPTKLIGNALEHTLPTIAANGETLTVTVTTETTVISDSDVPLDADNPVETWDTKMSELIPDDELAADTNLLLADQDHDIAGQGDIPCDTGCTGSNHTAAVVTNAADTIKHLDWDDATGPWQLDTDEHVIPIAVHEAGHTVGLHHDHGTGEDDNPPEVTPMLGTYIYNEAYAGRENHFGKTLPDEPDSTTVICRDEFNQNLSLGDITTAE